MPDYSHASIPELGWIGTFAVDLHLDLPSGKLIVFYGKWPFIVDLPIENGDFPPFIVDLPILKAFFFSIANCERLPLGVPSPVESGAPG